MPTTLAATKQAIRRLEVRLANLRWDDARTAATIHQLHQLRAHAQALRVTA